MGRWSETYYDDVFNSKLKGLVSGAITRAKLEKGDLPTITFKHFVEDLDAGDSFTTSIIELLVQELAERRSRNSPSDRRLIAERTAKNLRLLATPIRVYRDRRAGRRTVNLTEYLTSPPEVMDMEDDDDDEFETLLDRGSIPVEGVRINSELVDAYSAPSWTTSRRVFTDISPPTPSLSEGSPRVLSPPIFSPPRVNTVWNLPSPAPGSLTRQSSIRRPIRSSRTVDFNDFTSRRRSTTRDRDLRADPADDPWTRTSSTNPSTVVTRRFFPFSSQTRRHDDLVPWGEPEPEHGHGITVTPDEPLSYTVPVTEGSSSSSTRYFSFPTPEQEGSSTSPPPSSVPRLRRGGVRPPESLLLRRVSPGAPRSPVSVDDNEAASVRVRILDHGPLPSPPVDEPASYPTPGDENEA
ncbi:hypothetical protein FB45DRAFT_828155 [Roridomyces roridus]|uniref:Uncharacterized protein n=1 Tax=Roridomyces roridus TaxID=1738132 RepID=A0AAD7C5M8_9AGAR|nr:hypothetical protein FB45DRAFT_828155 [Roridomyces roridus]